MVAGGAMKAGVGLLTGVMLVSSCAWAEGLPDELLLRCDLKQTSVSNYRGKPDFNEINLVKDFRLKSGVIGWTNLSIPIGTDCKLMDGEIACSWAGTIPIKADRTSGPRVEKRESSVRLRRATGEIRLTLETWGYPGDSAKGTPDSTLVLNQSGVCRTIGKPIF